MMVVPGGSEFLLIVLIILIFFGAKKIPDLAKGIGKGIKEFKKGVKGEDDKEKLEDERSDKKKDT